ncbi:MAG: imidazoleglycerol-phosphate dehydratase HisB [Vicinamibacteria bacterium]|nr:imidazoleglycerol-phosphate dehydratase HisB [Vicinamibacteria bacterium]
MKEKKTTSAKPASSAVTPPAALPRRAILHRKTRETDINLFLDLDGRGAAEISTGIGFFDHMLAALATHARFDLKVTCKGDLHVDAHHVVEDVGIVLGEALAQALGDKKGVTRFGHAYVPFDETLVRCVVDLSGRVFLHYEVGFGAQYVGSMPVELFEDFFRAFSDNGRFNLHLDLLRGRSAHHVAEALFKAAARALAMAAARDPRALGVPSTKGAL